MVVYKTTNLINGKIYVGRDCTNEKGYLGSGVILEKAIKKYGRKNFIREVLEYCTIENINEREIYWIAKLDARNQEIGYNLEAGGQGRGYGHPVEQITREKIVAKLTGIKLTVERTQHMSDAMLGEKNPFYARKHTLETRAMISKYRKGRPMPEATRKKISEKLKLRKFTPEHRQKINDTLRQKALLRAEAKRLQKVA